VLRPFLSIVTKNALIVIIYRTIFQNYLHFLAIERHDFVIK